MGTRSFVAKFRQGLLSTLCSDAAAAGALESVASADEAEEPPIDVNVTQGWRPEARKVFVTGFVGFYVGMANGSGIRVRFIQEGRVSEEVRWSQTDVAPPIMCGCGILKARESERERERSRESK